MPNFRSNSKLSQWVTKSVCLKTALFQRSPISKEEIKKQREKRESPEGKLDKNGKPLKFSRDQESDWTVKNDKPHYGLKEHAAVDTSNGFVLATELTPSSVSDSIYLPYCVAASSHTEDQIKKVYADKGYYGGPNSKRYCQVETFEKYPRIVIPAKAGIQKALKRLDSCFRRNDDLPGFGRNSKVSSFLGG